MRIGASRILDRGDRRRIEAEIEFEDVDRPPITVFYETGEPLAQGLEPLPEAFVLAVFAAASWQGERRLRVEGSLDRTLTSGLQQVLALLHEWYDRCTRLALEPTGGSRTLRPAPEPHAAALCSGGLDALVMLKENLETYPADHPRRIRTITYLSGATTWDFVDGVPSERHVRANERNVARIRGLAEALGFAFTVTSTNAPVAYSDARAYHDAGHAATLVAPLVAAGGVVTDAHLASSGSGVQQSPHGSHPMADGLYATGAVRVHLDQPLLTRHAKTGLLANWEPAFDFVAPCHHYLDLPEGSVNCGRCEKCIRTMTSLLAWGALERFTAFPVSDVTPEMIRGLKMRSPLEFYYFQEPDLLRDLGRAGREDLVRAIREHFRERTATGWRKRMLKLRRSLRKRLGRPG